MCKLLRTSIPCSLFLFSKLDASLWISINCSSMHGDIGIVHPKILTSFTHWTVFVFVFSVENKTWTLCSILFSLQLQGMGTEAFNLQEKKWNKSHKRIIKEVHDSFTGIFQVLWGNTITLCEDPTTQIKKNDLIFG